MSRRGRRREVGRGRSRSSQVRVRPQWRRPRDDRQLARALALYMLWCLDHSTDDESSTDTAEEPS